MINTIRYIVSTLVLGLIFSPIMSVKADQIFAYSDVLSSTYNLNMGQTWAKVSSGRASTADDSASSGIASSVVANPLRAIVSARLDATDSRPSSTRIIYFVSNNNGFNWVQVDSGYTYNFETVGNELRWKAVIARDSQVVMSAYIDNIYLSYTVSDTIKVSQNNYSYSTR